MPPKPARTGEYIETDNGNKISRRAQLHATQHIILAGKSVIQQDVVIRGDLVRQQPSPSKPTLDASGKPTTTPSQTVSIHLGRYVFISPGCTLHPPSRLASSSSSSTATSSTSNLIATVPAIKNYALTSTPAELAARRASAQAPDLSPASTAPPTQTAFPPPTTNPTTQPPETENISPTTALAPLLTTSTFKPQLPSSSSSSSSSTPQQTLTHYPLRIASHVFLGPCSNISSASIGSHVYIGARCTIGNMVIIKDNVRVEDDTVLPAGTVWRSGVVIAGRPGRVVGRVGEGWASGSSAGVEGLVRELWASVGNHVRR